MRATRLEHLLMSHHQKVLYVHVQKSSDRWTATMKTIVPSHVSVEHVPPHMTLASLLMYWETDTVGCDAFPVAPDSALLRTLNAAGVSFELWWDAVAGAFRATVRLFPESGEGPVLREGCLRWCFDGNAIHAVHRVAAHVAQQLVLDHQNSQHFDQ